MVDSKEKLSPSNPFFEGDNDEEVVREEGKKEKEEDRKKEQREAATEKSREEDILTPTNPFSDDFVDEEPLANHLRKTDKASDADAIPSAVEPVPAKVPPSKPPRILLQVESTHSEEGDEEEKTPTNAPESPCKRVLSVDKSLLADLKVRSLKTR